MGSAESREREEREEYGDDDDVSYFNEVSKRLTVGDEVVVVVGPDDYLGKVATIVKDDHDCEP